MLAVPPAAALDVRYVDTDGDLVADTPAKTVDPPTLIFAYTPGEDPASYQRVWDDFLQHLEKTTGKRIRLFAAQNNAAQIEAMRAGRLHIAGFGTGTVPIAVNCAGFVPFAIMGGEKGILGYEMEIITYPGSGIREPADLKGRKLAFTSPTSNSGFKAPSVLLRSEFGLEAGKDYVAVFSGRHENSVLGVAYKDYVAAAIANEVMQRMMARDVVKKDQIVTVYKSETFPTARPSASRTISTPQSRPRCARRSSATRGPAPGWKRNSPAWGCRSSSRSPTRKTGPSSARSMLP